MATKQRTAKQTTKTAPRSAISKATEGLQIVENVVAIPLDQIDPESFENCRTGEFTANLEDPTGQGSAFGELFESIASKGQLEPVTVRPKEKGRHGLDVPFELIKGFRRYAAVALLADRTGDPAPVLLCRVKQLDDTSALEENLIENTGRDNLTGPDLAMGAWKLFQRRKAEGNPISVNNLAKVLAKNQSYINKLIRICEGAPTVARMWQQAKAPIGYDAMLQIATLKPKDGEPAWTDAEREAAQVAEYERRTKPSSGSTGNATGSGGKPVKDIMAKKAERLGTTLGTLQRVKLVDCSPLHWTVANLAKLELDHEKLTAADKSEVAKAGKAAFEKALAGNVQATAEVATA
jgi:ParB/RepB/Spo0J family partition protein